MQRPLELGPAADRQKVQGGPAAVRCWLRPGDRKASLRGAVPSSSRRRSRPQQEAQCWAARRVASNSNKRSITGGSVGKRSRPGRVSRLTAGMEEDGSGSGEPSLQLEGRSSFDRAW